MIQYTRPSIHEDLKNENDTLLEEYRYDPNGTRYYEMNTHREIAGRDLTYQDDDCLMSAGDALL